MADQRERIVLEVDQSGVATAISSGNRSVASIEASFVRAGQTFDQKMLAKIAQLKPKFAEGTDEWKRLDTVQQKVLTKIAANADAAGSKFSAMGEKIKNAIQNPMQAAGDAIGGLVTKLGPLGVGLSVAAVGIGAVAKAGWDWAKSLAAMGDQIEDTASRMGLTIREAETFRFAMNRAGSDMGTLEGIMRKLSQEIDTGGASLTKMGIRFRDVQTGELRPMSETILELSQRLAAMPEGPIRNAAAIKVMGRAALEVLPDLVELSEGVKRAGDLKIGWSADDVKKAAELRKEIADLTAQWDYAVMKFKQPIAATVIFTITGIDKLQMIMKMASASGQIALGMGPKVYPDQGPPPLSASENARRLAEETSSIAKNDAAIRARLQSSPEEELSAAKKKLDELAKDLPKDVMYNADRFKAFDEQKAIVKAIEARIEAIKKLEAAEKQLQAFEQSMNEKGMGPVEKIFAQRDEMVKAGVNATRATNAALVGASAALADELVADQKMTADRNIKTWKDYADDFQKSVVDPMSAGLDRFAKKWLAKVKDIQDKARKTDERAMSDIEAGATHQARMGELAAGPGQELAALQQGYALRVQAAKEEFAIVEAHSHLYDMDEQRWKLQKEMQAAGYEYEEKVAELQKSRFENLRSSTEGLLDAAFARSKSILDALKGMVQAVFLTPIKQGISSMMANALMPMMYGKEGNGGIMGRISGVFGGGGINGVRLVNGAVPVVIMGAGGGGGGGSLGGLFGGSRSPAMRGEIHGAGGSTSGLTKLASGLWDRTGGMQTASEIVGGPGGTSGFAGPVGGGGGAVEASSGGGIGGYLKGMSGYNGWKGMLSNLGNIGMRPTTGFDPATGTWGTGGTNGVGGSAGGVGGWQGGAMLGGGSALAMDGIRRGGWLGVAETTAGGAMIGAKFGGPVGAAVGGLIGFGVGVARLFIKSAAEKVMEKVRTVYGLTIDKRMGQQIADLAKQKYSGNLDMAVRASETRDLLRLYAQTMGQKVPASLMADQARSASLVQSGGELFQQAQYDNGQAYTYASSLRTYGGVQSDQISTASSSSGSVNVYLNQQQTVDLWKTGTTAAIQGNPRGVAASAYRGNAATNSRAGNAVLTLNPSVITQ
jgi:hypothetical protein